MKAQTMRSLRQLHHYVGVFFAPMIILFALSGAFQTFRWQQESGYGGTPPRWIVWMASVHIDQSRPKPEKVEAEKPKPAEAQPAQPKKKKTKPMSVLALKIFVAFAAIGLILSSLLGIIIALNNSATRRISLLMLVAGAAVPMLFLAL
jgi:hypothetical protein